MARSWNAPSPSTAPSTRPSSCPSASTEGDEASQYRRRDQEQRKPSTTSQPIEVAGVMIMTTRAITKNSPDTLTVQATAVIKAAASQRSDRARSHAQKAAAQKSDSV